MAGIYDELAAQVAAQVTVETSAELLIQGIADQLKNYQIGTDPSVLAGLISQLEASRTALAASVAANTVAAKPTPDGAAVATPAHALPGSGDPGADPLPSPGKVPDGGATPLTPQ